MVAGGDADRRASAHTRRPRACRSRDGRVINWRVGGRAAACDRRRARRGCTPATVNADNSFSATVPISAGTNTIPIVATDPSGNTRTNQYQVSSSGPTTRFTYDANGGVTADGVRT